MADGTTTNYGFTLPEVGASEDTWGTKLNQNWTDLDADLASLQSSIDNIELFPTGTAMLFQQTAAPTGWTKSTTHNDKALRVVSGTASSGGTTALSTALGTPSVTGTVSISGTPSTGNLAVSVSGNIGSTTLSINQIPSHTHSYSFHNKTGGRGTTQYSNSYQTVNQNLSSGTTGAKGGSGSHNHGHNLSGSLSGAPGIGTLSGSLSSATAAINVQYVDIIIATKD